MKLIWAWCRGRHLEVYRLHMVAAIAAARQAREVELIDGIRFAELYAAAQLGLQRLERGQQPLFREPSSPDQDAAKLAPP